MKLFSQPTTFLRYFCPSKSCQHSNLSFDHVRREANPDLGEPFPCSSNLEVITQDLYQPSWWQKWQWQMERICVPLTPSSRQRGTYGEGGSRRLFSLLPTNPKGHCFFCSWHTASSGIRKMKQGGRDKHAAPLLLILGLALLWNQLRQLPQAASWQGKPTSACPSTDPGLEEEERAGEKSGGRQWWRSRSWHSTGSWQAALWCQEVLIQPCLVYFSEACQGDGMGGGEKKISP